MSSSLSDDSSSTAKWTCQQCTYANYACAMVCTMCRTKRRTLFITEPPPTTSSVCSSTTSSSSLSSSSATIYNNDAQSSSSSSSLLVSSSQQQQQLLQSAGAAPQQQPLTTTTTTTALSAAGASASSTIQAAPLTPSAVRWPCPSCTFMNVLQAARCSICATQRPDCYELELRQLKSKVGNNETVDMEHFEKINKALRKWSCTQCTYKNWPTVKACTMCRAPKVVPPPPPQQQQQQHQQQYQPSTATTTINTDDGSPIASGWSDSLSSSSSGLVLVTEPNKKTAANNSSNQQQLRIDGGGRVMNNATSNQPIPMECVELEPLIMGTPKSLMPFDESLSLLQRYLLILQRTADTGCSAFLEAIAEITRSNNSEDEKILQYIYQYGEATRRITAFESAILNGYDEGGEQCYYNHTLLEVLQERRQDLCTVLPKFFTDSIYMDIDFPGSEASDTSATVYRSIRAKIRDDYHMRRVVNFGEFFAIPPEIYNMKTWLSAGEEHVRVFMDFDERQIMKTICFGDTLSMVDSLGSNRYAPLILRNRGGGHSLVDAASQAMWGVLDQEDYLRNAIYHTLYMKEAMFRNRWVASLLKNGMKFDMWLMQRNWSAIMDCRDSGAPLEQIHVLVLAQVLNRAIVVLPIESSRLCSSYMTSTSLRTLKHPYEGFYPQLPNLNTYRCCAPLFLAFSNGNFHAIMLPPPTRSPALGGVEVGYEKNIQIHRHVRCPSIELSEYIQFANDKSEADKIINETMMFDIDNSGAKWLYHSMVSLYATPSDQSTLLWKEWMSGHFPKSIRSPSEEGGQMSKSSTKPPALD